jgi:hypothetical protein
MKCFWVNQIPALRDFTREFEISLGLWLKQLGGRGFERVKFGSPHTTMLQASSGTK